MARLKVVLFSLAIVLSILFQTTQNANAQSAVDPSRASTILVFDASNSMWGQIDGVSKIEIAREVIGDMLSNWDPTVDLGLVAYGHRRKGDCGDIENVIPVGPVDAASFSSRVNALVPRGKTPLTEAVRTAAEILNYRDTQSTIILVSDGIESCNANLCELAEELERGGVNFTAHVIGFDVGRIGDQKQLSCLADRTGGKYLTADTASELSEAFQTVAAAPPPPPPPVLRLVAVETTGGAAISDPSIRWTVVSLDTEATILGARAMASPKLDVEAGRYFARAEFDGRVGSAEFNFAGDTDQLQHLVLSISVTLDAPEMVEIGKTLPVTWTGPNTPGDFISIARIGTQPTAFEAYARTSGGSPSDLTAPLAPGAYELRYVAASSGAVLATSVVQVIDASATLDGPPQVEAGSEFKVTWAGPDVQGDYITVVEAGAKDRTYTSYAYTKKGSPAGIRAPDTPGAHEIRYFSAQTQSVIARLPIMVVAVAAQLEAPPTVPAGADLSVIWTGPDNAGDFITIVPVGTKEGKWKNYEYTQKGSPASVRVSDEPGAYELRYVTGQTRLTLARLPITVIAVAATLEAAPTAGAGAELVVTWTGPDNKNDYITIVQVGANEGKYASYAYTKKGSPLQIRMPDTPGDYELRYSAGQSRATLASIPISIMASSVTLDAPPTAAAGSVVKVNWVGPDNKNDYLTIVAVGTEEKKYGNYAYTKKGSPAELRMPDEPGDYEIRYSAGQSRGTLATQPITVVAVAASLDSAPSTPAGANVEVTWTGPDNKNDYITIVPIGTEEGKYANYTYTNRGSPLKIRAPEEPGNYEIRYISGQSRTTLSSMPIIIATVTAELTAPPTANAGSLLKVIWTGPDNKNDHIIIVPLGTDDDERLSLYTYTNRGSPLDLKTFEAPGDYELRYIMGKSRRVLARLPVTLLPVSATLEAPPVITAGEKFAVTWTGPDNKNDTIAIALVDAEGRERIVYTYTNRGNPLKIKAPEAGGTYELRYITAQDKNILARLPITVN